MYVYWCNSGQSPADAELNYIENAKKLAMYGVHLHEAKVIISSLFCSVYTRIQGKDSAWIIRATKAD